MPQEGQSYIKDMEGTSLREQDEKPSHHIWFSVAVQLTTRETFMMVTSNSTSTVCLLLLVLMTGATAWQFVSQIAICSGIPYDTKTHMCCEGRWYKRPEDWDRALCCKDKIYDLDTHSCCGEEIIVSKEYAYDHRYECYGRQSKPSADD
ncbi:hypothetical protein LSAT2_015079 [Lamellibrachia satsuma]|nr:hypothetical protein LSAT2_015079 [Lamellibrachia satsuma]